MKQPQYDSGRSALIFTDRYLDITPYDIGEQRCPPFHFYGPAVRNYWLLHYILSGKGSFEKDGRTYPVKEGQCFVIRPYETTYYRADEKEPWHYLWVGFRSSLALPERFAEQAVIFGPVVTSVFERLLAICRDGSDDSVMPVTALIWELLSAFCRTHPAHEPKSGEQYAALARSYIEREYMKGITVAELAERLHLDRSYFSTVFKKYVGVPPQTYIKDMRLSAAAELLAKGGYSVALVANSTGYTDCCNFSKMFKERYGVSPNRYAEYIGETTHEKTD